MEKDRPKNCLVTKGRVFFSKQILLQLTGAKMQLRLNVNRPLRRMRAEKISKTADNDVNFAVDQTEGRIRLVCFVEL